MDEPVARARWLLSSAYRLGFVPAARPMVDADA
jgi:hypothetical protein